MQERFNSFREKSKLIEDKGIIIPGLMLVGVMGLAAVIYFTRRHQFSAEETKKPFISKLFDKIKFP